MVGLTILTWLDNWVEADHLGAVCQRGVAERHSLLSGGRGKATPAMSQYASSAQAGQGRLRVMQKQTKSDARAA